MSNYHIYAIILKGCHYSSNAYDLIKNHKIPADIVHINQNEKYKFKSRYYSTFPQIYLNKIGHKGNLLLGGYSDLNNFIKTFKNKELNNNHVEKFMNNYKWSKKATLRFIELINLPKE